MTDAQDRIISEFTGGLDHVRAQTTDLQTVLARTLQALAKHGVQLAVDLGSMVRELQTDLDKLKKTSDRVVEQINQQRELVRTVALITSSLELDHVLNEIMDRVIDLTGAERAYLMLKDETEDGLSIRAARNWDRETISDDEVNFSRTLVNRALTQMEAIVATNAQDEFAEMKSVVQHGLRSILVIPLALQGRVVGVLYADNRIEGGIFSQDDIPVLTAFGTQAAIAIQNAQQFGQVREDLIETRRELEVLRVQIDQQRVREQGADITEDEFFARIYEAARALRQQKRQMNG